MELLKQYKKPFLYSLILHLGFFSILFLEFGQATITPPDEFINKEHGQIINSVVIDEKSLEKEVRRLNNIDKIKYQKEKSLYNKLQALTKKNKAQQQASMKLKKNQEKQQARLKLLAKKNKQQQDRLKFLAKKKQQQLAEIKKLQVKEKILKKTILKKTNQKLILKQKRLQREQQAKKNKQQKMRQLKIIEFSNLVKTRISKVWSLKKAAPDKQCILIVRLDKAGNVIKVDLKKSSGEFELDNSAIKAVYKASPFAIPNIMRPKSYIDLRLTLNPQNILM